LPDLQDLPEAHLNLGNVLMAAGRQREAVDRFRQAIALEPDYGMAHNNLSRALIDQGDFEVGREHAGRAVELIPDFPAAHLNYAAALMGLRRFAEAEAPLRRGLELQPDDAKPHGELGKVLTELGRFEEAFACHERAVALNPDDAEIRYTLGWTQYRARDVERSEANLRHAVSLSPELAVAWQLLGYVLGFRGRFEEASACLRRALELAPDLMDAEYSLALLGLPARDETELRRLDAILASPDRPAPDRVTAGFARAAQLDTAARYDEAFPYLATANALHRQQLAALGDRFDPAGFQRDVERLIATFTPELFSAFAGWGNPSQQPVFIVGMPRSGTSLVEQIAASHSRVIGVGERDDITRLADALTAHGGNRPFAEWDVDFVRQSADAHIANLQRLGDSAARVIDKTPDNIFYLGMIAALFPAARVILCQRDARDTCFSCYFQRFAEEHAFTCDLEDCARRFLQVDRLAAHWLSLLPLEMLVIDYEELVEDLEGESRRLIEFLGLDWEPGCVEFHQTQRPVFTGSYWQVRQPLYTHSVGRWRNYEKHLGPLLKVLAEGGV